VIVEVSCAVSVTWSALIPVVATAAVWSPSHRRLDQRSRSGCPRRHPRPLAAIPIPAAAPIATEPAKTSALICSPAMAVTFRSPPAPIVEFWT
jgi:hypothetical protein